MTTVRAISVMHAQGIGAVGSKALGPPRQPPHLAEPSAPPPLPAPAWGVAVCARKGLCVWVFLGGGKPARQLARSYPPWHRHHQPNPPTHPHPKVVTWLPGPCFAFPLPLPALPPSLPNANTHSPAVGL